MELTDYLRALRQHWVGAMLLIILGGALAYGYSSTQPKVYAADANGFVGTGRQENAAMGSVNDALARSRVKSYVDIAKSRITANQVIDDLDLDASPQTLISQISVDQPMDTVLLKIVARAGSPAEAQQLADAWVRALADQVREIEAPGSKKIPNGTPRLIPIESAELPTTPVAPKISRNTALGVLLGAMLGLGYAVIRSQFDRRLRTGADVEAVSDVPLVGAIPESASLRSRLDGDEDPRAGEALRKLRTNLMYMNVDNPPRVLVVTSAKPGEGKSTVAMHIATTLERSGRNVVLIDADLRRPTLADRFGLDPLVGLSSVLAGQVPLAVAAQKPEGRPRLDLLPAGPIPPNPSELLGSHLMRNLLREFDEDTYVVLDAPPLLVTDAAVLATAADGCFVVVSAGKTSDTELKGALATLDKVNARTLGVILNRASIRTRGAYGSYGYYAPQDAESKTRTRGRRNPQAKGKGKGKEKSKGRRAA